MLCYVNLCIIIVLFIVVFDCLILDKEGKLMTLSNSKTGIFIHRDLLSFEKGREQLRDYFRRNPCIPNHTVFRGTNEDGSLDTIGPSLADQHCTLTQTSFGHSAAQKVIDDYVYASYETFQLLIG